MTFNEKWAASIGGFMLAITVPITTARFADTDSTARALGRGLGIVVAALAIALLARFVYVKVRGEGRVTMSPWVLLIAGVIAMLAYIGASAEEAQPVAASAASSSLSSPQKT